MLLQRRLGFFVRGYLKFSFFDEERERKKLANEKERKNSDKVSWWFPFP
jgi:hypothetical protein